MARALKDRIGGSMGLKFVAAMTGVISVLMIAGTLFVTRVLLENQYRALETRGTELGLFLGKTMADSLLYKDVLTIDDLISVAATSRDILYIHVTDTTGDVISSARASFNRENQALQRIIAREKTEDVATLAGIVNDTLDVFEVPVIVKTKGAKRGTITIGFLTTELKKNIGKVAALLLGTSVIIVLALAVVVYFMARAMIVAPTREAVAIASNIASGDLTQNVRVRSVDELGNLGRGLNRMVVGLKGIIGNVQDAAHQSSFVSGQVKDISQKITTGSQEQAESVEEAASSVNEMHFALKEIAGSVENLSLSSNNTSSSVLEMAASIDQVATTMAELSGTIEDTSTAISQMSAAVRQNAENVETLSSAAEETASSALEISASVREVEANAQQSATLAESVAADAQQLGMRSIEKAIEGMSRIEASSRRTAEVVNRLGERAESIGSILTVIEDITDQTSLLALNAAILAAQAGEHGKGFGVVAGEIRELANRTAASTQEIGAIITAVQEETRDVVSSMEESISHIEDGSWRSRAAGDALKKILERADQSRDMSKSISKAAAEQARGVKQVSDAVEKINEMTHQIARATHEQKSGSDQITQASEKMAEMTRFVKSALTEQAKGGKDITSAVETINEKIDMVHRAANELRIGSDLIVTAFEKIKGVARLNADLAAGLNAAIDGMSKQSDVLRKEIEKFRT